MIEAIELSFNSVQTLPFQVTFKEYIHLIFKIMLINDHFFCIIFFSCSVYSHSITVICSITVLGNLEDMK